MIENYHRMFARNVGKRKPRRLVWDIETWGLDARNFAFACVIDVATGEEWTFHTAKEARAHFESLAPCIVYAHNQFGFDAFSIMGKMEALESKKIAMGTNIYELTLNRVRYRDTKHLFPMRLAQLGDALGFPKGETPEDYITGNRREVTQEDIDYCLQDCRILVRAINDLESSVSEWIDRPVEQVCLPLTTASLSYRVWSETCWPEHWGWYRNKKNGTKEWVKGASCKARFNQNAKDSYSGGRVQVICEPGEWQYDIVSADANSMFPSVQEAYEFPDIRTCRNVGATPGILDRFLESKRYVSWANVSLKASTATQRFLPNRNLQGRLDWTQDTYSGWLAEPELKYAIYEADWELDEIRELNVAKAHNPFRGFVRKFYDLRQEAKANKDPRSIFYKLLLNSGYGKFAQRSSVTRLENPEQMEDVFTKEGWEDRYELRFYDAVNLEMPFLVDRESLNRTPDSQWFGYASFITSGARVELQKGIHAAGEGAKYVDTDSVYMNIDSVKDFEAAIPLGTDMGEWGWEQDRPYAKARFWEPKAYSLHAGDGTLQKAKHKGVDLKSRDGKWLPQAGDLRQTQISTTTTKLYSALRRKLEPGVMQVTEKRSRRWM